MKRLVDLDPRSMDFSIYDGHRSHDFLSINSAVSIWAAELDRLEIRAAAFEPNTSFASVVLTLALFQTARLAVPIDPTMSDVQATNLFKECGCLHILGGAQLKRPFEFTVMATDVAATQGAEPKFHDGVYGHSALHSRYTPWQVIARHANEQSEDLATWQTGQGLRQPDAYFVGLLADVLNGRRIDCFAAGLPQRTHSSERES